MTSSRREFLHTSLAAGALAAVAGVTPRALADTRYAPARGGLKILVLGGTEFIGPALVESALSRGHTVTLFNRGKREKRKGGPDSRVEHVYGNRDPKKNAAEDLEDKESPMGLTNLKDRKWDVVIDNSGYYPRLVKASAELLAPNCGQYIFVSSISAYKDNSKAGQDETAETGTIKDPSVETMGAQFENYGPLKVLCEQAAEAAFKGRTAIVRPGYIVGPNDGTDRFTYWPIRISKGGEVLCPGTPNDPIQIIDVRDLADFMVTLAENKTMGTFNACGLQPPITMGDVVNTCKSVSKSDATFTWVDPAFLEEHHIEFPIWAPTTGESAGFHTWSNERARSAGLKFRSLETTCKDLLAWYPKEVDRRIRVTKELTEEAEKAGKPAPKVQPPEKLRAGPSPEQETAVLKAWHDKIDKK
jgi:2'-hydroxyisoflavone reductase